MKFTTMTVLVVMNVYNAMRVFWLFAFAALASCSNQSVPTQPAGTSEAIPVQETAMPPQGAYSLYCFERAGQIGAEPRRSDVCDVGASGAGSFEQGTGSAARNMATLSISAPSLEAVGVRTVSFILNRGSGDPTFAAGVHEIDQVSLINMELGANLPDRMVFVDDITGQSSLFSYTSPDAAILRERAKGEVDIHAYEIASAVLTINQAVDLPMDSSDTEFARRAGMVTGEQYIDGTLAISLIPIGTKGAQFGPTTFEFGTRLDWGYVK